MIKPISLRIRHTQAITRARETLIRDGRGEELKQVTLRKARRMVSEAQEQKRLKRCAALAAQKAIIAVSAAYAAQEKVTDDLDRERLVGLRDFVVSELTRIVEGKRP
jgi:hypothetical protein